LGEIFASDLFGSCGLRLVEISLTDRCQCRCEHCFAATENALPIQDELSTLEIEALLDDLAAMRVSEVCFSGGEPLLRSDIVELVAYAATKGLMVRLISNGIAFTEKLVSELKRAGLNWCSVSIDSPEPQMHDTFRGYPGCFERAMAGLKMLNHHGVPASIITIARKNMISSGELEKIVSLGKELGVITVRINFPVPIGRWDGREDFTLSLKEREAVRDLLRYGIVSMESPRESSKCTAGLSKINILPNGDVTPCVFIPLRYGNIRQQKLGEIMQLMGNYHREFKMRGHCPMGDPAMREKILAAAEQRAG